MYTLTLRTKFKSFVAVTAMAATLGLGGCADLQNNPKASAGTILGGIGGGVAGAQFGKGKGQLAATAIGTLAGAFLGHSIGASLDKADQSAMTQSTQRALEYTPAGRSESWSNPDSGHRGSITPTRTYQSSDGQNCREYEQTVYIDGRQQQAHGTACRENDGTWRISGT